MSSDSRFLLVGGGLYANRGCESYTKCTIRLIHQHYPDAPIVMLKNYAEYDSRDEAEPGVSHVQFAFGDGRKFRAVTGLLRKRLPVAYMTAGGRMIRDHAAGSRAVISMAADLYGMSWGAATLLQYILMGDAALQAGKKLVIWSSSIGNLDADPCLKRLTLEQFKRCALVLVREQASLDYLTFNGVKDNIRLVADPAFLLEPGEPRIPLPIHEPLEESIGFNLTASYASMGKLGTYRDLIGIGADCVQEIMRSTGRPVVLVPHVVAFPETTGDNDTLFHALVREELAARGVNVAQIPSSLRSWELKWVMGRLFAYVGSRWHSTIASFGAETPTVSITFSEKGPALNEFIFGHRRFMLHCSELTPEHLSSKVSNVVEENQAIRAVLAKRMPEIRQLSAQAGVYLKETLGD